MQHLWRAGSNATLVLIANTTLAQFDRFFATLPEDHQRRILVLRAAPHQTKLDGLAAAYVYAMPSRTDSFGIVYLEAWMYHLPVIGARAGGVPAVIEHEQNGLLVNFGDVAALVAAIKRLLGDRALARRMGEHGRAKVLRDLTFERKYALMQQVYDEALENRTQKQDAGNQ
jgi:glycosyltransferase involved in cell wall biosynthesis